MSAQQGESKQRFDWIDAAKGIGILLVVAGHVMGEGGMSFSGSDVVRGYIYSFHMSLFFIIGGILLGYSLSRSELDTEYLGKKTRSLARRLLIPFFIWSVIYYLLGHGDLNDLTSLEKWFASTITFRGWAPIWFLAALFWSEVFALLIVFFSKGQARWILFWAGVILLLSCVAWWFYDPEGSAPLYLRYLEISVFRGLVCLFFVLVGYLVSSILLKGEKLGVCIAVFLASATVSVLVYLLIGGDWNLHTFKVSNIIAFVLLGLLGSTAVIYLCKTICALMKSRVLVGIGQETLGVMCIHYKPFPFMNYATDICAFLSLAGFAAFLLSFTFVFACSFLGTKLLKRFAIF